MKECFYVRIGEASPLTVCTDQCKLLDSIHFCSPAVYRFLLQTIQRRSPFLYLPGDCMSADVSSSPSTSGADCMPSPQGLQVVNQSSGIGELVHSPLCGSLQFTVAAQHVCIL